MLVKYAEPNEITAFGKPLYKIADLSTMELRVYISETQLASIKIAQEVGDFIKNERKAFSVSDIETKGKNDFVSHVDKESEQKIVDSLSELLPEAGFVAEEGTSTKTAEIYNWIIDPLDGTTNFIHGLEPYAVSIALQKHDELVVGVHPGDVEFLVFEGHEIDAAEVSNVWREDHPPQKNDQRQPATHLEFGFGRGISDEHAADVSGDHESRGVDAGIDG